MNDLVRFDDGGTMQDRGVIEYFRWLFYKDRELSSWAFNIVLGLVLLWGISCIYAVITYMPQHDLLKAGVLWVLGVYLSIIVLGVLLGVKSQKPLYSFIGYTLMTTGPTLLLSYILPQEILLPLCDGLIFIAFMLGIILLLSAKLPALFQSFIAILFGILVSLIVTEITWMMIFDSSHGLWHWFGAYLFCAFICYHWSQYTEKGKTLDNAIDSGSALYLESVIFIGKTLINLGLKRD